MILYFLPGVQSWTPDLVDHFGLGRVVDDKPMRRETMRGPTGDQGMLLAPHGTPPDRIKFDKDRQTWQRRFGCEAWMGYWTDSPPGPLDLERPHQIAGVDLVLADGRPWTVAQLRQFDATEGAESLNWKCRLEQTVDMDPETGRLILGRVVDRYAAIWEKACQVADSIDQQFTGGTKEVTLPDGTAEQFAGDLLNLNYRIDLPEIAMLGLLTTETLPRVTQLGLDLDTLRRNLGNVLRRIAASGTSATASGKTPQTEA